MADQHGLLDEMLLRLADRMSKVEQQMATTMATLQASTQNLSELRGVVGRLVKELDDMRRVSVAAQDAVEEMRKPLQRLLELKDRFSGAYLLAMALVMVVAYLFQPLLNELYHLPLFTVPKPPMHPPT